MTTKPKAKAVAVETKTVTKAAPESTPNDAPKSTKAKAPIGKRTPRPDAAQVVAIATGSAQPAKPVQEMKAATPAEPAQAAPVVSPAAREATHQINFKASTTMAKLIAEQSAKVGGTRVLFATLLKNAGHQVSEQDLKALPFGRRRSFDG